MKKLNDMCYKTKLFRSESGFTLIEIMVAVVIMSMVILSAYTLFLVGKTQYKSAADWAMLQTGQTLAERVLNNDLREATLSFNAVDQPDDLGRQFFDLIPDYPVSKLGLAFGYRVLTLQPAGPIKTMRLIVNRWQHQDHAIPFDPAWAYTVGPVTAGGAVAGSLSYQEINNANRVSTLNPNIWQPGANVAIYSPVTMRKPVDPQSVPPRAFMLVGKVAGNDLTIDDFGGKIFRNHPVDPSIYYDTFDRFLTTVPAVGGGSPEILMRRVDMVELETKVDGLGRNILVSKTWNGTGFDPEIVLGVGIDRVELTRPNITTALVNYKLIVPKVLQKGM